jgi:hypothetical protein
MLIFFLIVGLMFLISGGYGLFYVNVTAEIAAGAPLFVIANIVFGTFLAFGVIILVFMALYNKEFD